MFYHYHKLWRCPTARNSFSCSPTLTLLLVQVGGWWAPLLGWAGLGDQCPVVLALPRMCQPPAAPCQGASQSLSTPRGGSPHKEHPPTPTQPPPPPTPTARSGFFYETEARRTLTSKHFRNYLLLLFLPRRTCTRVFVHTERMMTCNEPVDWRGRGGGAFASLPVIEPLLPVVSCRGDNISAASEFCLAGMLYLFFTIGQF